MIDTRLLLDDFEATARRLARKGVDRALTEDARRLAEQRREQVRRVDAARQEMNAGSATIGDLMRGGDKAQADDLRAQMADGKARLEAMEAGLRATEADLEDVVLRIPNLPADSVPDGKTMSCSGPTVTIPLITQVGLGSRTGTWPSGSASWTASVLPS
jgi:seryl-tRNA synthetase